MLSDYVSELRRRLLVNMTHGALGRNRRNLHEHIQSVGGGARSTRRSELRARGLHKAGAAAKNDVRLEVIGCCEIERDHVSSAQAECVVDEAAPHARDRAVRGDQREAIRVPGEADRREVGII